MPIEVIKEQLPAPWSSYLINGDGSGLEEGEEETIEQTLQQLQTYHGRELRAVDIEGEPMAYIGTASCRNGMVPFSRPVRITRVPVVASRIAPSAGCAVNSASLARRNDTQSLNAPTVLPALALHVHDG